MQQLSSSNQPDWYALAKAMADAIAAQRAVRAVSAIGRDGRMRMTQQFIDAEIALDIAERAFREVQS